MGNMSYCRFENTSNDLEDCIRALRDLIEDSEDDLPSESEMSAMENMQSQCRRFLERYAQFREQLNLDEMERSSTHPEG